MSSPVLWADRGQSLQIDSASMGGDRRLLAVARASTVQLQAPWFSIWLQVRGSARVNAREGGFELVAGDWIALDPGAHPLLQAGRGALVVGLALSPELMRELQHARDCLLYAGRGHVAGRERRTALRLWRNIGLGDPAPAHAAARPRPHLDSFVNYLTQACPGLLQELARCPGKSHWRKQQVFARLQRAKLFLEGNANRIVSLAELAQLTSFSGWYLSKTYQATYGETLQAASRRLRMARACQLLERTGMAVEDVAASCGFGSSSSFARAFRAEIGVTSTGYRSGRRPATDVRPPLAARL